MENKYRKIFSDLKQVYIPRRHIIVFLGCLGILNVYAMRLNLSVAIVAMTNQTYISPINSSNRQASECPNLINNQTTNEIMNYKGDKYNWDSKIQGIILGSYYYGYVITQLPGGLLAEKFGAKWVFGGGVMTTSIFSLLIPLAVSWGTTAFITIRVLQGLADGVTCPAIQIAISKWSPKMERSRVSSIIFSGVMAGDVLSFALSGLLCSSDTFGGWPSVFYLFGGIGVTWCICWFSFMHETPDMHPSISNEELLYIEQNQDKKSDKRLPTPWKEILTSIPVWSFVFAMVGHNFGYLMFLTELPTYLGTVLHYDLASNGFLSATPFILQFLLSFVTSWVADKLRQSKKFSITFIRKLFNTMGMTAPAICLVGVTLAGCRPELIVVLLSIGLGIDACVFSGYNVTPVDMAPNFSGTIYGLANTLASLSGFIAPTVVGIFLETGTTMANWSKVFYITTAIYLIFVITFLIFASADLQPWNSAEVPSDQECNVENKVCNKDYNEENKVCGKDYNVENKICDIDINKENKSWINDYNLENEISDTDCNEEKQSCFNDYNVENKICDKKDCNVESKVCTLDLNIENEIYVKENNFDVSHLELLSENTKC